MTPPVRLSLLGFEDDGSPALTVVERPESNYPLERQVLRTLFLDVGKGAMLSSQPAQEATKSYESHSLNDGIVSEQSQHLIQCLPSQFCDS
jgi:uncharacterized protein